MTYCLLTVDFSKAFDCVRHSTLMQHMDLLQLSDNIHNCLRHHFEARDHVTRKKCHLEERRQKVEFARLRSSGKDDTTQFCGGDSRHSIKFYRLEYRHT